MYVKTEPLGGYSATQLLGISDPQPRQVSVHDERQERR
jgi:hypothetical protein